MMEPLIVRWFKNVDPVGKILGVATIALFVLGLLGGFFTTLSEEGNMILALIGGALAAVMFPLVLFPVWIVYGFYSRIRSKFFTDRDLVECEGCGVVFTIGLWDKNGSCPQCGTNVLPRLTGGREPGLILPGWPAPSDQKHETEPSRSDD